MLVPIIFTLDTISSNMSQIWLFYKAITYAKNKKWPVIAQDDYFDKFELQKKIFSYYFEEKTAKNFRYDLPLEEDLSKVYQIRIPNSIVEEYINSFGSQTDAYINSFKCDWEELELYLSKEIEKYENQWEKIDGFVCLTHIKVVSSLAKKLNKKVFYLEWSPFRYAIYRNAAYLDLNDSYLDYYSQYVTFAKEKHCNLPTLSRREILALFLNLDYFNYFDKSTQENIYEIGIAGTYNNVTETRAYTNYDILEEYNHATLKFCDNAIAMRYHPGDPLRASINSGNVPEGSLFDFICKCKRIMSINSNVEFEAMLLGKPVYDESGVSRYRGFTNAVLGHLEDKIISDEAINYLTFVKMVPFELVDDEEYLKYRMSEPSDLELYKYHLNYYLQSIGLSYDIFLKPRDEWMREIKKARLEVSTVAPPMYHNSIEINSEINRLNNQLEIFKAELEKKTKTIEDQQITIENLYNSYSMRLTKPLRLLLDIIRRYKRIIK